MKAVIQRVTSASVRIEGEVVGEIGRGLLVLLGIAPTDTLADVEWMRSKLVGLRIFEDGEGKMNLDVTEVGGSMLIVSQFTLFGDCSKGRRPSFIAAATPDIAVPLYEAFVGAVRSSVVTVATGRFGADMQVSLVNDGPVTLIVER